MPIQNIFTGLLTIQDKHSGYFAATQTTVIDYIEIDWRNRPASVRITNLAIPQELMYDLTHILLGKP